MNRAVCLLPLNFKVTFVSTLSDDSAFSSLNVLLHFSQIRLVHIIVFAICFCI